MDNKLKIFCINLKFSKFIKDKFIRTNGLNNHNYNDCYMLYIINFKTDQYIS